MRKPERPQKVLVIGSGPIIIGQAAEFDYAGTQACKALREEGLTVVLVNSNPATIMTDGEVADAVYIEPLTPENVEAVIAKERPDGLLATLGGQTGLNMAVELAKRGALARYGVRLLGTPLSAIEAAEDREAFRSLMQRIKEPIPESTIVTEVEAALDFAAGIGYPIMVRPAYTLGGTGGGLAGDAAELEDIVGRGLAQSPIGQVLVEKSLLGWAEIEYEVMRDQSGTVITVCNMENFDPVGVHTGDSIVVAPSQTLTDREYYTLRGAAHRIIEALAIEGGCNVQFAYHPRTGDYYVIEVNPRVSRSSALASKATGYPIARIAAKVAIGLNLDEIPNPVTGRTYASFEPALDYIVVKIPRWPFDKYPRADRHLGTQMKATGEVMAIDRTLEGALQKAVRSLDAGFDGLWHPALANVADEEIDRLLETEARRPSDLRLFLLAEALRRGFHPADLAHRTAISRYFLERMDGLIDLEKELRKAGWEGLTPPLLREAKVRGFSDRSLARLFGVTAADVRARRQAFGLRPSYQQVDTCAGEFPAVTPYFYSSYRGRDEVPPGEKPKALVLGAGPIRIGQGIEFDYCSVHAAWALEQAGYEAILLNNNPETVSTDFDTAGRLYFEPLTVEDVLAVIEREQPELVFNQFGGQTALNLSADLHAAGARLAGTPLSAMDVAEDREHFRTCLDGLAIPQSPGGTARTVVEAYDVAAAAGYPVMVRPSYVLGGRAMKKVANEEELRTYMEEAVLVSPEHPVLIDHYIAGREVELDAVSDGEDVTIGGIFEHVEGAGVHSGDSMAFYPALHLSEAERQTLIDYTRAIARNLPVVGLVNIQFILAEGRVYVLEVNPRASRTVPILGKISGTNLVRLAVEVQLGKRLKELGVPLGLIPDPAVHTVKAPVFSFGKIGEVDPVLGAEMHSTGEVLGVGATPGIALAKAFVAASLWPAQGQAVLWSLPGGSGFGSVATGEGAANGGAATGGAATGGAAAGRAAVAQKIAPAIQRTVAAGFPALALAEDAHLLAEYGVDGIGVIEGTPVEAFRKLHREGQLGLVASLALEPEPPGTPGRIFRRLAAERRVGLVTHPDTVLALAEAFEAARAEPEALLSPINLAGLYANLERSHSA